MDQEEVGTRVAEADALYERRQLIEALHTYREVLMDDPNLAWAYSRIGAILAQTGDEKGAEEALLRAIELDSKLPQAHSNLGNLYYNRGDYETAVSRYKQAIALSPNTAVYHENLHAAYKKLGKLAEAVASLKQAHRIERDLSKVEAREKFRGMTRSVKSRFGCMSTLLLIALVSLTAWRL